MTTIPWLADVLRAGGCQVREEGNWKSRGRPQDEDDRFNPIGVLWHHTTARSSPQNPAPGLNLVINGRGGPNPLRGPLAHALVDFNGVFRVVAAGRANHAGAARRSGPIPAGDGNELLIGWEIDYTGTDQRMSPAQYAASVKGTAAVLKHLGADASYARGHLETSTGGKIDPAFINLDTMRADVAKAMAPQETYNPKWVGMATTTSGKGYWRVTRDGAVHSFGDAKYAGGANDRPLQAPIVGMATNPTGSGYWLVARDGGVFAFGDARFHGSKGGQALAAPIVGMAARVDANGQNPGYWLVAEDGGVFSYGKAPFKGSMGGRPMNHPVKGMAAHPSGNGYWLVGLDGGVFTFGDARFHGSRNGKPNSGFVVGVAPSKSGKGYWLASTGGGVYSFGDALFAGSAADKVLAEPVLGINADPDGKGYRLHAGDGGVFTFQASFHGTPPR